MKHIFISLEELIEILKKVISEEIFLAPPVKSHDPEEIVDLKSASDFLSLSPHTIRKYVRNGKLKKAFSDIRVLKFSRKELSRFSNSYRP